MSELRDLYQEVIIDHSKRPRNFRKIEDSNREAEGYNPLCGDQIHVYLRVDGDLIQDVSFQGSGCAISTAAASLMTDALKNKTVGQAQEIFEGFRTMITANPTQGPVSEAALEELSARLGKLAVFSGVCEFPARVKCASLPWHAVHNALENKKDVAVTEG